MTWICKKVWMSERMQAVVDGWTLSEHTPHIDLLGGWGVIPCGIVLHIKPNCDYFLKCPLAISDHASVPNVNKYVKCEQMTWRTEDEASYYVYLRRFPEKKNFPFGNVIPELHTYFMTRLKAHLWLFTKRCECPKSIMLLPKFRTVLTQVFMMIRWRPRHLKNSTPAVASWSQTPCFLASLPSASMQWMKYYTAFRNRTMFSFFYPPDAEIIPVSYTHLTLPTRRTV